MARSTVRDVAAEAGVSIATVSRVLNGQDNVTPDHAGSGRGGAGRARLVGPLAAASRGRPDRARSSCAARTCCRTTSARSCRRSRRRSTCTAARCCSTRASPRRQRTPWPPCRPATSPARSSCCRRRAATSSSRCGVEASRSSSSTRGRRRRATSRPCPRPTSPGPVRSPQHLLDARSPPASASSRVRASGSRATTGYAGHAAAMVDVGILPPPELVRFTHATSDDGERAAGELLDLPDRPTALVCFNDQSAVGALRAAAARGLRVPDDVSIAGLRRPRAEPRDHARSSRRSGSRSRRWAASR